MPNDVDILSIKSAIKMSIKSCCHYLIQTLCNILLVAFLFLLACAVVQAQMVSVWQEDFSGNPGQQPYQWQDESQDSAFNCQINYHSSGTSAKIERTAESSWGKILSPIVFCHVETYPMIQIHVSQLSQQTTWKLGVQEIGGSWRHWTIQSNTSLTGTFEYDYNALTDLSGAEDFYIEMIVEGGPGSYVEVDWINVHRQYQQSTPTPIPSPTPTLTSLNGLYWIEDFSTTPTYEKQQWQYDPQQLHLDFDSSSSCANVNLQPGAIRGAIQSQPIICRANLYNQLEIHLEQLSAGSSFSLSLKDTASGYIWKIAENETSAGTFNYDYHKVTGINHETKLAVIFELVGSGANAEIDYISLSGPQRKPGIDEFVKRHPKEETQLVLQNQVVKIKGVNFYPSQHGWGKMWDQWDHEAIDQELSRCQEMYFNTVRTFVHFDECGGADVTREMLARMEQLIYSANKNNCRVQFTFFPMMRDYGPANLVAAKEHLKTIINHFKDDERIFAWGVTNELDLHTTMQIEIDWEQQRAYDWHNEIAATIRELDRNHLIVAATARPESMQYINLENIDVYALHTIGHQDSEKGIIMRTRYIMEQLNQVRPILFEEFGLDFKLTYTAQEVEEFYSTTWDSIYQTDIAGGMVWLLSDIDLPDQDHLDGLYTLEGSMRPGTQINKTAYRGTNFKFKTAVSRPDKPLYVREKAENEKYNLLYAQMPQLGYNWRAVTGETNIQSQSEAVRIAVAESNDYGSIETTKPVILDLKKKIDVEVEIVDANKLWYAFIRSLDNDYQVRLQMDTAVQGTFVYQLENYIPDEFKTGDHRFAISIGAASTKSGEGSFVLVKHIKVTESAEIAANDPDTSSEEVWDTVFQKNALIAYPNPAREQVTLAWKEDQAEKVQVGVYSITGDLVLKMEEHPLGNTMNLAVNQLAPGIYLYRMILTINGNNKPLPVRKLAIID